MNKTKILTIIAVVSIILNVILGIYSCNKRRPIVTIEKVDSIEKVVDSIYITDTILLTNIKNNKNEVKRVEKEYKADYNCIVNADITQQCDIFTEYLQSQSDRGLFDSDDSKSIEAN